MDVKDIEQILGEDPNIVEFIPAESWEFSEIDYSKFGEKAERMKRIASLYTDYLESPYILFGSRSERERADWEDAMLEKHGPDFWNYYRKNSLRGSALFNLAWGTSFFVRAYTGIKKPTLMLLHSD